MKEYLFIVLGVIAIIAILYLLARFNKKFRETAYSLFIYAENNLTEDKMDYVVEQIYYYLPTICRILPESFYRDLLQKLFDEVKDLLDDGRINNKKKRGK